MLKLYSKRIVFCFVVMTILAVGMIIAAAGTKSLIREKHNQFLPAEISLAVVENGKENTDYKLMNQLKWEKVDNNYETDKKIEIANLDKADENNTDAYIRVCIIPRWTVEINGSNENGLGDNIITVDADLPLDNFGSFVGLNIDESAKSYNMGPIIFNLDDNWNENWFYNSKDGYFYYKDVVHFGSSTEPLLKSVTISEETKSILDSYGANLTIDILTDGIQSEGNAIDNMWGNVEMGANGILQQKQ